jgi:hypothetical protein
MIERAKGAVGLLLPGTVAVVVTCSLIQMQLSVAVAAALVVALVAVLVPPRSLLLFGIATVSYERVSVATPIGNLRLAHLLLATACLGAVLRGQRAARPAWVLGPLLLVILPVMASAAIHGQRALGAAESVAYLLNAGLVIAALALCGVGDEDRPVLLTWYIRGASLSALVGLYQVAAFFMHLPTFVASADTVGGLPRALGFSYEPAFFALTMVFGLLAVQARGTRQLAAVAVLVSGAVLSNARVLVLLVVVLGVYGATQRMHQRSRRRAQFRLLVGGGIIATVLLAALLSVSGTQQALQTRALSFADRQDEASNAIRLRTYSSVLAAVRDGHMALGVGPGRLGLVADSYGYPSYALRQAGPGQSASPTGAALGAYVADNIGLQALADAGFVGLVGLTMAGTLLWVRARRSPRPDVLRSAQLALIVAGSLVSLGYDPKVWTLFAVCTLPLQGRGAWPRAHGAKVPRVQPEEIRPNQEAIDA